MSKYGEKRRAAKLEKQARIKREFQEKHEKTIEFLSCVCWMCVCAYRNGDSER